MLGTIILTHDSLVRATESSITEKRAIGDMGASLKFRVSLQGVEQPSDIKEPFLTDASSASLKALGAPSTDTKSMMLGTVRLTCANAWGFELVKKRKVAWNIYCLISVGESNPIWRTSTVKSSIIPEWNECSDYAISDGGEMINITVFNENKVAEDDELGSATIPIGKLLKGGLIDVGLEKDGNPTVMFVSLGCEMISRIIHHQHNAERNKSNAVSETLLPDEKERQQKILSDTTHDAGHSRMAHERGELHGLNIIHKVIHSRKHK